MHRRSSSSRDPHRNQRLGYEFFKVATTKAHSPAAKLDKRNAALENPATYCAWLQTQEGRGLRHSEEVSLWNNDCLGHGRKSPCGLSLGDCPYSGNPSPPFPPSQTMGAVHGYLSTVGSTSFYNAPYPLKPGTPSAKAHLTKRRLERLPPTMRVRVASADTCRAVA
jgi:hypothetical protein